MKRIFTLLRILPFVVFCLIAATAAVRVQLNETASAAQPQLPTRIGTVRKELSYPQKLGAEMTQMWSDLFALVLPGMPTMVVSHEPKNSLSLDALKSRNKRLNTQLVTTMSSKN